MTFDLLPAPHPCLSQLNMIETPLWNGWDQKEWAPLPSAPIKGYCISPGGTGHRHFLSPQTPG